MRGSPLLHCLLGVFAFALFAVPLSRLTMARPQVMNHDPAATGAAGARTPKRVFLRVRFAHTPKSLSLKLDGKELLASPLPRDASPFESEATILIPKDGLELNLAAQWPDGTPDTAVTVELEPDELEARRETRWSSGPALHEILNFKW